jgi:NAD(P)-dependent dehydrogenase (short-subunit alcohol dehydrogenase family)
MFVDAVKKSPTNCIDMVIANAGISGQDPVFLEDGTSSLEKIPQSSRLIDVSCVESDQPQKPNLKILDINLIGVTYTTKLALFYFRKQFKAAIEAGKPGPDTNLILQGSLAGYVDQPGSPQYNASKFGLRGMMRCLRRTSLQHGTRINYIAPW